MPDTAIETALAHWGPRLIQNGVDYNDLMATIARTETWADWLPQWNRTADEQAEFAREADATGHALTAGQAWRRASVNRHFGKFVWMVDLDLAAEATHRSVWETRTALERLDPSGERLEIPIPDGTAYANLRRPAGVERPPYVVVIPGLDSTKEEFFYFEQSFLDRGMATVSLDGPGQGETGLKLRIRPDYEVAVSPLLDLLSDRDDLDHARIGVAGVSLGAYYAPRAVAHEPRVAAVAAISGPFRFGDMWDDLPPMTRQAFVVKSGARDDEEGRRLALTLDLDGVCQQISVPALYVTGKLDRLIPWQQTQRQADETPKGTFVCFPEGNHGVSNLPSKARPMIADWMADHLGVSPDTVGR
ncbi:alpha/beta fold hydrolase [Actinoplanes sp. TBRC 11911]|uniref:alpha/beta hydrolase family protein n=1 Tax=Actinoplanes sp. TBRC 11911 TaxID=2729386 RepID=UPI00145D0CB4|nr:alpha/beta hydrolase [Actinoplanes sp. TBRC 11911]NMO49634.1 alpha/beta fold hydrolase [Actinoplanes sp. TBRC 11911]